MAERRSVYKKISLSETVDGLSEKAQLFFTWSIPHADDVGVLPRSPKTLKGMIFPLKNITANEIESIVQECINAGLYVEFRYGLMQESLLAIVNFSKHQTLKKDRQPQTLIDYPLTKQTRKNWENLENIVCIPNGNQMEDTGIHLESEGKGREGKGSELRSATIVAQKGQKLHENASDFIRFFSEATRAIRHIDPIIEGGKDGRMINLRLKKLEGDMARLEKMAIWYLTRKKKVQDNKGNWREEFKNSPAIATMLSASYFNQLLSEEKNAQSYMSENFDWVEKVYSRSLRSQETTAGDLRDLLASRFNVKTNA